MKKQVRTIAALLASMIGTAEAKDVTLWLTQIGTAQDSDRDSAANEAAEQATEQTNALCIGQVVAVERTGTSCFGGDGSSPFTCIVTVKAECQVHYR